jgi:hypothetical protein
MGSQKSRLEQPGTTGPIVGSLRGVITMSRIADRDPGTSDYTTRKAWPSGRAYIHAVLKEYVWLPGTPHKASRHDRRTRELAL